MYKEYFGLQELPFSIAPDPRYLYMSEQHREALAHLIYGINTQGGFVLLTGEVGTGKTTVCRCLLDQIPEDIDVAFILNPKMTVEELLASICDELRIQYPQGNNSIKVFIDHINAYLLDAHTKGRKTVLIIEEAQNLGTDVLEQIRLLTNLETTQQKLLQIIMLGQPELRDKLSRPELRQLSQRITARYHLGSLSRQEISEYVSHRLSIAGVHRKLFPDSVINLLYRLSNGVPRLINLICDRALLGTYVQGKDKVDKKTLLKATREVLGKSQPQLINFKRLQWVVPGILLAVLIVIAIVITIQSSEKKTRASLSAEEKPQLSRLTWPEDIPIQKSKKMAFKALLSQWGIIDEQNSNNPCAMAQSHGLQCLKERESLRSLIRLNRPAVLKMFDDQDRAFFVTLTEIQEQTATFVIGTETKLVDVKDIALQWLGDYIILWRMPPEYTGFIQQGTKGPQVQWLDERLASIQGKQKLTTEEPVFDNELVKRVKEFQLSKGLVPDGIVGPQTIIHLNLVFENGDPLLSGKQRET
jgi:general secretion pathway protein A